MAKDKRVEVLFETSDYERLQEVDALGRSRTDAILKGMDVDEAWLEDQ
jgi:hypothetical protein